LSSKKAFTLVEIVVALALVCGAVVLWTYILSAGRNSSNELDEDQAYNSLRASLIQTLKRDVRSSVAIKETSPSSWEIETIEFDDTGLPGKKLLTYEIDTNCTKVSITEGGKVKTYDFSKILKGKKLNFKIIP